MKHLNLGRVLLLALCTCLAVTLLTTVVSPARSAYAATDSQTACSNLNYSPGNFFLAAGTRQQWTTCKGNTMDLNMQTDGNFVLYVNGQPKWASHTSSSIGNYVWFQRDGNLVVYNIDYWTGQVYPAWSSSTRTRGAARLSLQDDGNLVIYTATGKVLWASHTSGY